MDSVLVSPDQAPQTVMTLQLSKGRVLDLREPVVMGILNVTPDSFSDGGAYLAVPDAVAQAQRMIAQGAALIDIGGESSRPGSQPIAAAEEQARVLPVIRAVRAVSAIPISIDTTRASTAEAAIDAGADIVNDISALRSDPDLAGVIARSAVPLVLMHMQGTPQTMQQNPSYGDCVAEIGQFFSERLASAAASGIDRTRILLDPGIGFGKRLSDNLALLAGLSAFLHFGCPLLVGVSRKSFISAVAASQSPDDRLGGSLAAALAAVARGARIIRAHDVQQTVQGLAIWQAISRGGA